jgi:hypothetical protein
MRISPQDLALELAAHAPLVASLEAFDAFQLASLVQLARRHPSVQESEGLSAAAERFLVLVRAHFADAPVASQVLILGDDRAFDAPKGPTH